MAVEDQRLLCLLQHADSVFPSGAVSFSAGLEALRNDGLLRGPAQLATAMRELLRGRFLGLDRSLLTAAWQVAPELPALLELDRIAEAANPAREAREASRRAGSALLGVHRRLGTPGAAGYETHLRDGGVHGHLPVVQGLVWRGAGLTLAQSTAAAAHGLIASTLSAALRLGVVGHVGAQALHAELRDWLGPLLEPAPPAPTAACSNSPLLDIAAMRHEVQAQRLFAS